MAFPFASRDGGSRYGRSRDTGPVFAIGQQAFADCSRTGERSVSLLDEKGTVVVGKLRDGAEVEIVAWIPRGSATRYRVRATGADLVGWLAVSSLRSVKSAKNVRNAAVASALPKWIAPRTPGVSPEIAAPAKVSAKPPPRKIVKKK